MGSTHTHEAAKTDAQVQAEKEIASSRLKNEAELKEKQRQFNEAQTAKNNDLARKIKEEDAKIRQKHANRICELEAQIKEQEKLVVQEKKKLLEPDYLKGSVEKAAIKAWNEFAAAPQSGEMACSAEHTAAVTYSDLTDVAKMSRHVELLFQDAPLNAKNELVAMANSVVNIVKECSAVNEIVDSRKNEHAFNVDTDGAQIHFHARYVVAFRYNKVTEAKARSVGMIEWLAGKKPEDLTTIGISFKLDVHTSEAKKGALTLGQSKGLKALGLV